jgi:nucleoside-diphosphate-sugar epimerase
MPVVTTQALRFQRPRLLVVGCGDVGMRLLPLVTRHFRVFALTSQPQRCAELRAQGAVPIVADLDQPESLWRLAGLADMVIHLAPPQPEGEHDRRTRHLVKALGKVARLVYISTSGVYGDCGGDLVRESRPVAPSNPRAHRRVDAERVLRKWARDRRTRLTILRVPGIYANDRLPLKRLELGTPALRAEDDVFTNHIHADDLARIAARALLRGLNARVVHAVDDTRMKMGDYFDAVADAFDLARPPRLPRAQLQKVVTPALLSFMSESRRLDNARLKRELRVRLHYPDVAVALARLTAVQSRPGARSANHAENRA